MKAIINKLDLINEKLIIHWNLRKKDLQSFASKLTKKIPDPNKTEEYYQS